MKTTHKIICTALATSVLLGFTGVAVAAADSISGSAPAVAAAQDPMGPGDEMKAESTKRFVVTNLSGNTLRLKSLPDKDRKDNSDLPKNGTLVLPGQELPLEVTYYFLIDNPVSITWDVLDDQGNVVGAAVTKLTLDAWNQKYSEIVSQSGPAEFKRIYASGDVTVTDRNETVHEIPAGQGQRQANILNRYCEENSAADCEFDVKESVPGWGPRHPVDAIEYNNTDAPGKTTVSKKETVGSTNSVTVGASMKASVLSAVEFAVNTAYTKGWSNSEEFTWTRELIIKPYYKAWLEVAAPVVNHTGDFTVKVGKTTWILHDVTFTSPDKDGVAHYFRQELPLTDAEKVVLPPTMSTSSESISTAIAEAVEEGLQISTQQLP